MVGSRRSISSSRYRRLRAPCQATWQFLPIKSYNYFTFVNFQIKLVQENIFIMAISLVTPFSSWTQMLGANIMVNFNGSSLVDQANTLLTESSVNISNSHRKNTDPIVLISDRNFFLQILTLMCLMEFQILC